MNRLRLLALLLTGAALAASAPAALAQSGVDLAWNDCGGSGLAAMSFACDTNDGVSVLYGSVIVGTDMPQLNGMAALIDMVTNQAALSPWWDIGGCRPSTALGAAFDFAANFVCFDPWGGQAVGGLDYTAAFNGVPNRARIHVVCAIPGTTFISGTDEYYMFKVNLLRMNSTGAGACAGCTDGACIYLRSIFVTQPAAANDDRTIINPLSSDYVTWQVGGGAIDGGCPSMFIPDPTRTTTWGGVKSLYR